MAQCGIASRRKCEQIILQKRVTVNGKLVDTLGVKINPDKDEVCVDGKTIKRNGKKIYIMLNKPFGVISSAKDEKGRKTVLDVIKARVSDRVFPVGRLDFDTTGLIILTNDGDFAYRLTHPKHEIKKTYIAQIDGIPTEDEIKRFKNGLIIDGKKTSQAEFEIIKIQKNRSYVKIVIHEGRNRQVKKMCEAIGHKVLTLKRVAIGNLELGNLKEGEFIFLDESKLRKIFE